MIGQRLSGMDAAFLYGETENAPLNVIGTVVLESLSREPGADFERLRAQIAGRLSVLPMMRRKLVEVPFGLDQPRWIDDPHFDLDDHVFRRALRAPGDDREFSRFIARAAETPLRRDRPLWEIHVVEGLAGRRVALVVKMHHAAVDGRGSVALLAQLLDRDPEGKELVPVQESAPAALLEPEVAPSALSLLGDATRAMGDRSLRGAMQILRGGSAGARILYETLGGASPIALAPRTRLNGPVSGRRVVALGCVSLDDVKEVKRAFAATVNHVVLAACAGALRSYLADCGETPSEPFVASVPMALDERAPGGSNALSVMRVRLPVHEADPLDRLAYAREASHASRRLHEATGALIGDWAELPAPALLAGASQLYHRLGLAAHHAPLHNVVISNVQGPPQTLYCAGSRVTACHPFGPIYDGWGLNLTVLSYDGRIGLGAIACPERVPGLEKIPRAFEACVQELHRLAKGVAGGAGASAA